MSGTWGGPAKLLSGLGIPELMRKLSGSGARYVLTFHGVAKIRHTDIPRSVQPSMSVDELRVVLNWLRNRFTFLSPDDFFQSTQGGVLLTFDDGLASNYVNALPLLAEFNAPAIFFVSTQHVMNPRDWLPSTRIIIESHWNGPDHVPDDLASDLYDGMSEEQLRASADHPLITIGSHTRSHPRLTACTSSELGRELSESKRFLAEVTGTQIDLLAYPYGIYDHDAAMAVSTAGYQAAFAMDPIPVGMPEYEIPRVGVYWSDSAYLDVKLSALYRRPVKQL